MAEEATRGQCESAKVTEWEIELDEWVYRPYALTKDEIAIVELRGDVEVWDERMSQGNSMSSDVRFGGDV